MNNNNQDSYELILKQTTKKKGNVLAFKKTYPAYIILIIFIIASFFVRHFIASNIESNLKNEFDKSVSSVTNRLTAHYSKQIEVIVTMSGLYDLLVEVVKDYFELYATIPTTNYPSILSVAYAPQVYHSDIGQFIINARNLGYYDYKLKVESQRPIYFPLVNIVPEFTNLHRSGIDLAVDPIALEAINKAKINNMMTATEVYNVREPDTLGYYIFYPIYKRDSKRDTEVERKENFQAVLSLEIDFNKFIAEALSGKDDIQNTAMPSDTSFIFEIFDTHNNGQEYSIFKSKNYEVLKTYTPKITQNAIIKIADKELKLVFYTIPDYGGKYQQLLPNLSLIVSLILSFAFFGFVLTQMTNKAKALDLADKMTRSQRRIVDTSNDIIAILDKDLVWKSMNPASLAVLGYLPEDIQGKEFGFNLLDNQIINRLKNSYNESKEDHIEKFDIEMVKADGTHIWVDWSFTYSNEDALIYCIGRDVTLEKQAEADAKLRSKQIEATEIISREANYSKSYFMKEMSHQLRNSLTGILGYLQLLQTKVYDNEEELDMYVDLAATSSEELFTYVTDIDEAAKLNEVDSSNLIIHNIQLGKIINNSIDNFKKLETTKLIETEFNFENDNIVSNILGTKEEVGLLIDDSISLLSEGVDKISYDINVEVNPYEGAVELQILSSGNKTVFELINTYKSNNDNIIDILKFDKNDVILKLHKINSTMRLLRGSFKVESFGEKDGNLISIIFKSNKII